MFSSWYIRPLLLVGMLLLCVASATHAFEHWELARTKDCVAHTGKTSPTNTAASHDHGCTAQDHAPAIVTWVVFVSAVDCIADVEHTPMAASSVPPFDIDHPPQLVA